MSNQVSAIRRQSSGGVRRATVTFGAKGGFVVDCPDRSAAPYPATDSIALAELFEELAVEIPDDDWDIEPPALDEQGLGIVRGSDIEDVKDRMRSASAEALAEANDVWGGGEPVAPPAAPSGEVTRSPLADPDGTEYPAVEKRGPNHYVFPCPVHGESRMQRQGTNWVCTGKTNRQACTQGVPAAIVERAAA